jgi:hypothetical protein
MQTARALCHSQEIEVMVAQQALRAGAIRHQAAQHTRRVRAAVDQITQQVQCVAAGRKIQSVEQLLQGSVTALYVANQVKCHVFIFAWVSWNLF